jgi:hypothetical protein
MEPKNGDYPESLSEEPRKVRVRLHERLSQEQQTPFVKDVKIYSAIAALRNLKLMSVQSMEFWSLNGW